MDTHDHVDVCNLSCEFIEEGNADDALWNTCSQARERGVNMAMFELEVACREPNLCRVRIRVGGARWKGSNTKQPVGNSSGIALLA